MGSLMCNKAEEHINHPPPAPIFLLFNFVCLHLFRRKSVALFFFRCHPLSWTWHEHSGLELAYRASGERHRSVCTLVSHKQYFDGQLLARLMPPNIERIGKPSKSD